MCAAVSRARALKRGNIAGASRHALVVRISLITCVYNAGN